MTVNQRIIKIYESLGITQSEFSRLVKVPQSRLSNQILGKNGVGLETIQSIVGNINNLNSRWLITGNGEMWLSENLIHQDSNFELNELKEDPPQYELKKNEQPIPAVMPDDVAVLKKAVELLQIEMWKLKGEVEEMKKKEKK